MLVSRNSEYGELVGGRNRRRLLRWGHIGHLDLVMGIAVL